jgi:hypothetical protein
MLPGFSASARQAMTQPAALDEQSAPVGLTSVDQAADDQVAAGPAPAWPRRPALAQAVSAVPPPGQGVWAGPALATTAAAAPLAGRSHMTARGALVSMFGLFLAADLAASWTGHQVPAGVGFLAACVLGPYLVRKHALLQVIAASPAIFLVALIITQIATAQGTGKHGKILSVLEGTVLVLAALAPWLLSGVVLGVVAAIPRGLVQCTRDLKQELREDLANRRPWAPRPRRR